jgi:hypothetical protein
MKDGHPGELGENCSWPTCEIKVKKSKGLNAAIHPELWGYLSCPHKLHFFFFAIKTLIQDLQCSPYHPKLVSKLTD